MTLTFPKTDLILKRALELHPGLIWNLSDHGDRMRRFTSGKFAQTLSRKEDFRHSCEAGLGVHRGPWRTR